MDMDCLADCPPSLATLVIVFIVLGGVALFLMRWRFRYAFIWLFVGSVTTSVLIHNPWGSEEEIAINAAFSVVVAARLVQGLRERKTGRAGSGDHAA